MEVESVVADAPSLIALLLGVGDLVSLAIHTGLHDMVPADGAVVDVDVPGPKRHGIPLSHFKSLLCTGFDHFCLFF